jgi:type IV pilus assembly protein PilV
VVELMIALAVLAIGVSGIIAMQKVTIVANQHAKNLAAATHIAQTWQDQLAADAVLWNSPSPNGGSSDIGETRWLERVTTDEFTWFVPDYSGDFGAAFDALGNPLPPGNDPAQAAFCAHVRLSWLHPQEFGRGLIRTEVRVFWLRDGGDGHVDASKSLCDPEVEPDAVGAAVDRYHFVYQTSAAKQNTLQ